MKLWQKGATTSSRNIDQKIEAFTIGRDNELDMELAPFDVLGTIAHAKMLHHIRLLSTEELRRLTQSLKVIYQKIEKEDFAIEPGIEDIHSQVELELTRELGETGKKVHSGRSRNDQVLLDIRLYTRKQIEIITQKIHQLFNTLQKLSEQHKDVLMPGYTHTQVAMPSSFGLWFGAFAESLTDDLQLLQSAYKITNQNPLGSAAGYGSSFPLDRTMTTNLLGFDTLSYNVVYAQMGRGKVEKTVSYAMASLAGTLNKLSSDVCIFMSQNFGFVSFPDHLTTGSSIMPHKKNPDVFELVRARSNQLQNLPQEIAMITTNMISGYHRDLQLIKESFFPALDQLNLCLDITDYMLQNIKVNPDILEDDKYQYLFSVEAVNKEVLQGVPFRDAYQKIGQAIEDRTYQPSKDINHTHEGSIGNLCNDQIREKMDFLLESFRFEKANKAMEELLEK